MIIQFSNMKIVKNIYFFPKKKISCISVLN